MRSLTVIWFALSLSASSGLAQTSEPAPTPSAPAATPSIQAFGDQDKTCVMWSDGCRTCRRADNDEVTCSNIGIACQPVEIICTFRRTEPAK